ncbi:MAG: AMP-binding protein [Anaerovoracaceae bacterium]
MLGVEAYKAMKDGDMKYAQKLYDIIQNDPDPNTRYKDSRKIMDIKHLMETSASDEWYGNNVAFYQKWKRGEAYTQITYKEALADMNALGTALIDEGLKDKRIAVVGENCYQWAISYLATLCGTGIVVPLDKELNPRELEQLIVQAEVSCVIFKDKHEEVFKNMVKNGETLLKRLVNMDRKEDQDGVLSWHQLIAKGKAMVEEGERSFLDAQIYAEDMSVILFTSGTTGVSKGVMLNHRNLVTDLMVAPTVLKVNDWDIFFSVLPLHHTYECTCGFLMPLYKGAAIAYCEGLKYITKNLEEVKPTMFLGVPVLFETLYKKIWKNVQKQGKEKLLRRIIKINRKTKKVGLDLGNVFFKEIRNVFGGRMRMMIVGGAAINPEVLDGIADFGITALQGYGLTECAPMGALNPDKAPKSTSIGRKFPACDLKIVDANEEGIGEIWLKGGNVMMGYYHMPEATAEVITDGWFHTGDLGYVDQEGYAVITGRKKNVIITKNGKNVYPEELEYYLSNISLISESMVFGEDTGDGEDTLIVAAIKVDDE